MEIKRNVRKIAELGIAVTAIAAVLVAGCGGGGGGVLGLGGTSIFVAAGNSPLIGVTMKAECANGSSGQGLVGAGANPPGEGTIQVSGSCNYPIRITAIGPGKMRPIGAKSDGTEDVNYDPAVNIPVATVVAQPASAPAAVAAGTKFNVDPVTTLVANIVAPAGAAFVAPASSVVAAAQAKVETALGLTAGDLDKGYLNPGVAAASTRIVEIAALTVNSVTAAGTVPSGVGATKSLGQYVAEKIANAGNAGVANSLATATGFAGALKTADATLDVTAKPAVTGGAIDTDAAAVSTMIIIAKNMATSNGANLGAAPQTVANLLTEIQSQAASGVNAAILTTYTQAHTTQAAKDAVTNASSKMVADVIIAINAASGVAALEQTNKLAVTQAAATKMIADMDSRLNSIAASAPLAGDTMAKVMQAAKVVSDGIAETMKQDLAATSKVFGVTTPAVGASIAASTMVADLADKSSKLATTTAFNPVANAPIELKLAGAFNALTPPLPGDTAATKTAFDAALAAVVTKIDAAAPPPTLTQLQTAVNSLQAIVVTNLTGQALGIAGTTAEALQALAAAQAALGTALGTATTPINFTAPPTVGAITTVFTPPPPVPAPPTVTPVIDQVAAAATAAKNAAIADAATAAAQATAAQTAAATAASQAQTITNGATGTAAQTAAAAAQTAATDAHTALTAAQAAAASAATNAAKVALAGTAAEVTAAQAAVTAAAQSVVTAQAAVTAADQSAATAVASVVIPPSAPTIGTVTVGDASATVSFTASTSNGGSVITGYTVTSNPGGITATGTASPITVNGLVNGTAYTFTVVATNKAGNSVSSGASASKTPAAVPGAPTAVSATAGNAQATVSFTASANTGGSTITGYTVTSSPGNITATGTASPIVVTGLTNGTAYTFTVKAANSVGSSAASTATTSVTPMTVPGAPTAVMAAAGNTQATVSFTAPSNGGSAITGYTVTSSPGGFTGTGSASPITVTGLTNGTAYTFTVTATNAKGTGAASSATTAVTPAVTPAVPGAPTAVAAVAGDTSATVSFTAPANGGSSAITGYTVTSSPGSKTATGTASPLTVTGLTNGTAYTFTVKATNSVGSSVVSAASASVTPMTVPGAPTAVTAAAGNTQATVSFTAPSNGGSAITGYTVTSSPGGFTGTGSASPITVTGLTNGTAYTFTVTATNAKGPGAASSASAAVTPAAAPPALNLGATTTVTPVGHGGYGVNDAAPPNNTGVAYTGAPVTFGPYTVSGLAAPTSVTMFGVLGAYEKIQINGATAVTSGTVSNGDTLTVVVDLAAYAANLLTTVGAMPYAAVLQPKIKAGAATITFGTTAIGEAITLCSDPTVTPTPGTSQCL